MGKLKCCYPECGNCPFADCIKDDVSYEEMVIQDKFDRQITMENTIVEPEVLKRRERQGKQWFKEAQKRYRQSEKGKLTQKKYNQSEKCKLSQKKYAQSEKGKLAQKRYNQSEKGKATMARKQKKKCESGKNAEYCRRYYQKKKLLALQEI
jgi:hypothetical protein